jgi:hypothetical protein
MSPSSQDAKAAPGDQVGLGVEGVVDRCRVKMDVERVFGDVHADRLG